MPLRCPAGHASSEPDYCSVCGAALPPAPTPAPAPPPPPAPTPAPPQAASPLSCPLCGEPRAPVSCPVCCYDFDLPPLAPPGAAPSAPVALSPRLVVAVDPSLDDEPDPALPCPTHLAPAELPTDPGELVIGRHDPQRPVQVPIQDPGASRKHAKIVIEAGFFWVLDLGSTNGTRLNGEDLTPHEKTPLRPGDHVTLGRWTRITLR